MGRKHSKDDILQGALDAVFDDGLSQLTFGRLAKRLGTSDRIIVYYFPTKDDLITEVMGAVGLQLQLTLAEAFTAPAADQCVARDQTAAVVADGRYLVEFEQIDHAADAVDVLVDRQRRVVVESARAGTREVDDMTRHVVDQVWQQRAERRSLTGQPWTNSTSGPLPTWRWATSPAPTSRKRSGGRRSCDESRRDLYAPRLIGDGWTARTPARRRRVRP